MAGLTLPDPQGHARLKQVKSPCFQTRSYLLEATPPDPPHGNPLPIPQIGKNKVLGRAAKKQGQGLRKNEPCPPPPNATWLSVAHSDAACETWEVPCIGAFWLGPGRRKGSGSSKALFLSTWGKWQHGLLGPLCPSQTQEPEAPCTHIPQGPPHSKAFPPLPPPLQSAFPRFFSLFHPRPLPGASPLEVPRPKPTLLQRQPAKARGAVGPAPWPAWG